MTYTRYAHRLFQYSAKKTKQNKTNNSLPLLSIFKL